MAKRKGKPGPGLVDLSNEQVLNAAEGFGRLLLVGFPQPLSMDLHDRFQALKFAAAPVNAERDALVARFTKRDRKGRAIAGEGPGTVVLVNGEVFQKEAAILLKQRRKVKVALLRRSDIPAKVFNAKLGRMVDVVIEGEVWELLGPLLVD